MLDILNLDSLEPLARERLDPMLFDYIAGGAADEWTLGENRAAWSRCSFFRACCAASATRSLATTVLGTPVSFPVLVPPMAFHGLCHLDAEAATARATAAEERSSARARCRTAASRRSPPRRPGRAGFSSTSIATARSRAISWTRRGGGIFGALPHRGHAVQRPSRARQAKCASHARASRAGQLSRRRTPISIITAAAKARRSARTSTRCGIRVSPGTTSTGCGRSRRCR